MSPTEQIRDAIKEALATADAANNAASSLTNLVLNHRPGLISETTIVREAATLLLHVTQNYSRLATVTLDKKQSKKEARNDS
jgi:hypothetical protein